MMGGERLEAARASEPFSTTGRVYEHGCAILVGLLGRGIQLSRTPAMHEAEARARGISYIYRLLDTELMGEPQPSLADLLTFAEHLGFSGFNVTFPYKQEILPLLDELSPAAREVNSVNTVVLRNGRRFGHNTDVWGFRESFRRGMDGVERDQVLLLGAGGAGAAVGHALLDCEIGRLLIVDAEPQRADQLAARLKARFGAQRAESVQDVAAAAGAAAGIVNATPVGMAKLPGMPLRPKHVAPRHWVADIVYFPLETALLRHARGLGCRTLSGEGMAVFQAVRAFELFTGIQPDVERMKAAFAGFDPMPAA
ncbi:shikimate dehydrogenase [Chelativorans salis]|uniref:Shikimate dehydrogenase (NADP(+)) n=1 Tax=Chelativorans salis TaxID=2978478 RepID=A0ABT2LRW9_9HYPH|nr:shikimate dehydrogenase [Chelativorans sp. EGI FJ00035]MCT7377229.1 shikimate dehydrogenase [Chelativorans sp. EGI FJ00035]